MMGGLGLQGFDGKPCMGAQEMVRAHPALLAVPPVGLGS
jgi:hypothetical protein